MVVAIVSAWAFWLAVYSVIGVGRMLLRWVEPVVYRWLRERAMDRILGKPAGTVTYRRRIDQRPPA